jgi:hypothetical protein
LPWADPYIMQLFCQLHVPEDSAAAPAQRGVEDRELPPGERATTEAVFVGRSWSITPLNRPAPFRKHRTVSEHLMAHC